MLKHKHFLTFFYFIFFHFFPEQQKEIIEKGKLTMSAATKKSKDLDQKMKVECKLYNLYLKLNYLGLYGVWQ